MVSISTETNGIVDHSELIEVFIFLLMYIFAAFLKCIYVYCFYRKHTCGQYFSVQHRPFSNPALVQKSMGFCTPKNKVKSPGGSCILFYGDQGFISPVRALPRFVFKIILHRNVPVCKNLSVPIPKLF